MSRPGRALDDRSATSAPLRWKETQVAHAPRRPMDPPRAGACRPGHRSRRLRTAGGACGRRDLAEPGHDRPGFDLHRRRDDAARVRGLRPRAAASRRARHRAPDRDVPGPRRGQGGFGGRRGGGAEREPGTRPPARHRADALRDPGRRRVAFPGLAIRAAGRPWPGLSTVVPAVPPASTPSPSSGS